MQIREIMTKNPACATPDSTLQEVAKLMVENDCGCIPVVDSKLGMKPVGTITDRDIAIRTCALGKNPISMKASDIMTTDIVTITPETSVNQCGEVMKRENIRRVLVTDKNGNCIGIVAQADVAEYGPNPTLISDVVNDISQSAPTPHRADSREYNKNKSFSLKNSLLDFNTMLPLLAGLGAGAAIKYYFYPSEKSEKQGGVKHRVNLPVNRQPDEFDKMASKAQASNASTSKATLITEKKDVITGTVTSADQRNETPYTPDLGRSAGQS